MSTEAIQLSVCDLTSLIHFPLAPNVWETVTFTVLSPGQHTANNATQQNPIWLQTHKALGQRLALHHRAAAMAAMLSHHRQSESTQRKSGVSPAIRRTNSVDQGCLGSSDTLQRMEAVAFLAVSVCSLHCLLPHYTPNAMVKDCSWPETATVWWCTETSKGKLGNGTHGVINVVLCTSLHCLSVLQQQQYLVLVDTSTRIHSCTE